MLTDDSERARRLEEKLAYLERHVGEQDRAMLEMAERLDELEKLVAQMKRRAAGEPGDELPANERPPHY